MRLIQMKMILYVLRMGRGRAGPSTNHPNLNLNHHQAIERRVNVSLSILNILAFGIHEFIQYLNLVVSPIPWH
jgi:hypothetical protein